MSSLVVQSELPENWTDTKETLIEGMVFNLKYLGMTLVGQPKGEDMASAAIRRIVTTVSPWFPRALYDNILVNFKMIASHIFHNVFTVHCKHRLFLALTYICKNHGTVDQCFS